MGESGRPHFRKMPDPRTQASAEKKSFPLSSITMKAVLVSRLRWNAQADGRAPDETYFALFPIGAVKTSMMSLEG